MSARKVPKNDIIFDLYVNKNKNAAEIARMYDVKNQRSILNALRNMGVEIRKTVGKNHGMWKGGKISCKGDGYYGIHHPTHERADSGGYVYEHTLIAEKKYGRLPIKGEVVHHINCNKHDNRAENLWLCGHKEHLIIHRSIEKLIKPLMEQGIVIFNEHEKEYQISKPAIQCPLMF